jgi:hypothetical protein
MLIPVDEERVNYYEGCFVNGLPDLVGRLIFISGNTTIFLK